MRNKDEGHRRRKQPFAACLYFAPRVKISVVMLHETQMSGVSWPTWMPLQYYILSRSLYHSFLSFYRFSPRLETYIWRLLTIYHVWVQWKLSFCCWPNCFINFMRSILVKNDQYCSLFRCSLLNQRVPWVVASVCIAFDLYFIFIFLSFVSFPVFSFFADFLSLYNIVSVLYFNNEALCCHFIT